jgi:hypothetical protein
MAAMRCLPRRPEDAEGLDRSQHSVRIGHEGEKTASLHD